MPKPTLEELSALNAQKASKNPKVPYERPWICPEDKVTWMGVERVCWCCGKESGEQYISELKIRQWGP